MSVEINWLAVVLATVSSMVVGGLWYSVVFAKPWIKMAKIDEKQMGREAKVNLPIALITAGTMAYVLAHVTYLSHSFFLNSYLQDALTTGFWMWLGFQATRLLMRSTFEQRRKKLILLNLGNDFVTIMVMALIIGLIKP